MAQACSLGKAIMEWHVQKDAYTLILESIEGRHFKPGDRLVESELAEQLGVSRTPVREALQRLETQSMVRRDGRSLIVASLDHNQVAELYVVRTALEGLAARLAASTARKAYHTKRLHRFAQPPRNVQRRLTLEKTMHYELPVSCVRQSGLGESRPCSFKFHG